MFSRRPNRLPAEAYNEGGAFSLTVCTAERRQHFCRADTVEQTRALLLCEASRLGVEVDVYCFMPDHLHLLVRSDGPDIRQLMKRFKQASGVLFRRATGDRLWQKGYHDHCVRNAEVLERIAEYILDNPVRQGLCAQWYEYPFSWSRWHTRDL
jgi:REP element-mobilizing transposase RayT